MKPLREAIANIVIGDTPEQPGYVVGYDIADAIISELPLIHLLWLRYSCAVCGAEMSEIDVFLGDLCVLCREDDERGTIPHTSPSTPPPVGSAA